MGEISHDMSITLHMLKNGEEATIQTIPSGECARRLEALGLRAGKKIRKVSGMPFKGPVTLILEGRQIAIGNRISRRITVFPIS